MAKPSAAASGALGAGVNIIGSDVLPQAGALYGEGTSQYGTGTAELSQYATDIQNFLSTNPTYRMEADAAAIGDATALAQGQKASILNQGRGGAQQYELGLVDQNTATQIGNALSTSFNQAFKELGQLGEFQTATGLTAQEGAISGEIAGANTDVGAGGEYVNLAKLLDAQHAQLNQEIMQIGEQIAQAFAGGGGGG